MPKNKELVKAHTRAPRFRENTRLMRVHESMVDFLKGAPPSGSLLDVVASSFFGLDILNIDEENDLIYSDDDDDEVPPQDPYKQLQPHPRIKQLTDEEADKQAKELIEEEQRKGRKKKKNKHKKLRKKEKKRLEKENAEKNNLPEEEQEKSDSSESPEENAIIEKKTESKEKEPTAVSDKKGTESGCDELSKINKEVEELAKNNEDQEEATENTELNTSYPSNTESAAEETHQYTQETKEEKSKTVEDEEEKPEVTEEPEAGKKEEKVHMMKEMKQDVIKEEPMDPTLLEFAQRSRDLAAAGNRLAAAGQYEMAVKYFTDAIKYNPRETKLFGNRSLCFERMHQYENALSDAVIALTMEPNWTKGLFRKGKALCGLKKYYEASLVYKDVLKLDSSSKEAMQELKRAQTLHLMEMGFTWAQSCDALKTHATLEEAVEALFCSGNGLASGGTGASVDSAVWRPTQEDEGAEKEWTVQQTSRPRTQHAKESSSQSQPTLGPKSSTKPQVFSVWVGSMAPTITYTILHEVFSRAGNVVSIKMLLEHNCAFVNYAKKQDSDRAIQCINGMVVEGIPLLVRYPSRNQTGLSAPKWATGDPSAQSGPGMYKKECFFWRTMGCNRDDCIYRHIPEHKGLDKDKFTSGLGPSFT